MKIDDNPRLPYDQYMMVQSLYLRRRPVKPVDQGCITAPTKSEGSRFHAKG